MPSWKLKFRFAWKTNNHQLRTAQLAINFDRIFLHYDFVDAEFTVPRRAGAYPTTRFGVARNASIALVISLGAGHTPR